jgi:hypothetical protein
MGSLLLKRHKAARFPTLFAKQRGSTSEEKSGGSNGTEAT